MDTIVAVETTIAEETRVEKSVEVVEIALNDLDCVAGGSILGSLY